MPRVFLAATCPLKQATWVPATSVRERLGWIDTARGLAIVLVTAIHATEWLQQTPIQLPEWDQANELLSSLRMPLLFMCSGVLGRKYLTASWSQLVSRKILFLFWIYLLWQPIGSLMAFVAASFDGDHLSPLRSVISLILSPVRPRYELWFIWSLGLFFLLARASLKQPVVRQFVISGLISMVWFSSLIPETNDGWDGLAKYYVFFLIGCYGRDFMLEFAERVTPPTAFGYLALWFASALIARDTGLDGVPGVGFLVRIEGLYAGIALAILLQRVSPLRRLGSQTLPVYLAHTPIIIAITWVVSTQLGSPLEHLLTPALPLLMTLIAIPLSLWLHTILMRTWARVFFGPPDSVTELVRARVARAELAAPEALNRELVVALESPVKRAPSRGAD